MEITKTEIDKIDAALGKMGVAYMDIRMELTDHVANELENCEGDFDSELAAYLKKNKKSIKRTNRKMFFASSGGAYVELFKNIKQIRFLIGFSVAFSVIYKLCENLNQTDVFRWCLMVFCIVGGAASFLMLFRMFVRRRSYSGSIGFSVLMLVILYLTIYLIKFEYTGSALVLMCLYLSIITVGSVAMLITAEKQYQLYKQRYA